MGAGLAASLTNEGFLATVLGWLTGLVVAAVFGALAYLFYEVSVLLAVLTAGAGATAIVVGVMLLVGVVSIDDLGSAATTATIEDDWWWYVAYAALSIAGIVAQVRATMRTRGSLRGAWEESGGRQMRAA